MNKYGQKIGGEHAVHSYKETVSYLWEKGVKISDLQKS